MSRRAEPVRPTPSAEPRTANVDTSNAEHRTAAAAPTRRVLSVTELTVRVRDLLEAEFVEIWVEGELSNCRVWNTGHLYFTLKDGASQIKGVIFRSALRYLKFKPADGLRVVARGRVSVYEPKGEYQLVCEHLEPHGLGALQLAFDQLKKRLQAEGLFDAARKRPLPALPRKIGIVTSLDGAAMRDIIKVLRRRYANAHLVIRPARVQGEDAAPEIARALRADRARPGVDVVIVGRGGGSIEDLWAFNEEVVARAIARVPVPVISAVGHETDVTIADFVADCARRRRRRPPSSWSRRRTSSAAGSIGCAIGCAPPRARSVQRLEPPRAHASTAGRRSPASAAASRCAAGTRAELSHALARVMRAGVGRARAPAAAARTSARARSIRPAASGGIRTRLVGADGRLRAAAAGGASIAPTRNWRRRRPARHAQPARGARPRLRGGVERRPDRVLRDAPPCAGDAST